MVLLELVVKNDSSPQIKDMSVSEFIQEYIDVTKLLKKPFYLNEPDYEVNGDLGENFDEDFIEILKVFNLEEAFESFFGDHVKVIATKDGFDVQEYENHD